MKHFRQRMTETILHTIPDTVKNIRHMSHETGMKLIQYLMLGILLYLCFLLPKTGAEQKALESVGQESKSMQQESVDQQQRIPMDQESIPQDGETEAAGTEQKAENTDHKGVIVIDSGHGGDDPGMIGSSGINEKVLNLIYGKKLKALLEAQGYQVVMTRETEDGLYDAHASNKKAQDMQRRVAVISENKPLLAVSIHQNSYPDTSVAGPQVFYYEHSAKGEQLAKAIQDAMNTELNIARPRVQKGNTSYYILKRSDAVTVIVECGFLSNPQEEAKLQEEEYQNMVAKAVCDGILDYLG